MRRAFTLVELSVVVLILVILTGLVLAVIPLLKTSQHRAVTVTTMEALSRATGSYLDKYAVLGFTADSRDFVADPLRFLVRNRIALGKKPYFEATGRQRIAVGDPVAQRYETFASPGPGATSTVPDTVADAGPDAATHLVDDFGRQIIRWTVINDATNDRSYTWFVALRSEAGTGDVPKDDIVIYHHNGDDPVILDGDTYEPTRGEWKLVSGNDLR